MTPTLLCLHGITMSGPSLLHAMGPLADALDAAGWHLLAPSAPHRMSTQAVDGLTAWARQRYAAVRQDADRSFAEGALWRGGEHRDWFDAHTDPTTGRRTYAGLAASLQHLDEACEGHDVRGILGFSQGAAMAAVAAGVATNAGLTWARSLSRGVFLSGFLPTFDAPQVDAWPIRGVRGLLVTGDRDPLFPQPAAFGALAEVLPAGSELVVVDGLTHDPPRDPDTVARIVRHLSA